MATAFFAGTPRLIQYFSGATKGGLLLTGGLAGAACAIHDLKYRGKDSNPLKKLAYIGLASVVSLGLTQSLKGRVSSSFTSTLKIVFLGGTITLLKNWVEHSPLKKAEAKPKETPKPSSITDPETTGTLLKPEKGNTDAIIRIEHGIQTCLDYSQNAAVPTQSEITLENNVYEITKDGYAHFIMTKKDFETLKRICHYNAFGTFHKSVDLDQLKQLGFKGMEGQEYMLLWKIPADLSNLGHYCRDSKEPLTTYYVGGYPAVPPKEMPPREGVRTFGFGVKLRTEFNQGTARPNVHHLKVRSDGKDFEIAGISTSYFCKNFDKPSNEELEKIKVLLDTLFEERIGAYYCGQHHLVVIGGTETNPLNAKNFADFLYSNEDRVERIITAIKTAAIESKKDQIDAWKTLYIRHFQTA